MKQAYAKPTPAICDFCFGRIGRACKIEVEGMLHKEKSRHYDVCAGCYRTWSVIGRMIAHGLLS